MKVCAIVIWYNPDGRMWKNISKYLSFVDKCIIVDNSEKNNKHLIKSKSKKIIYLPNKDNLGIAKALNQGCEKAKKLGFDWVLTMDQDSYFDEKDIKKYFKEAEKIYKKDKKAVSFSPNYNISRKGVKKVKIIITSGNLFRIEVLNLVGGFDENFFIYAVDTLFGEQLELLGLKNYQIMDIKMYHNIFDKVFYVNFPWKKYIIKPDSSPISKYYIVRNLFEKIKLVGGKNETIFFLIKLLIKVIFFEHKKIEKLKMIYRGYRDYKRRKFGKYSRN